MNRFRKIIEEILAGTSIVFNGSKSFDPQIPAEEFYKRILQQGSVGLGESYMEGWWDCKDLDAFFTNYSLQM